MGLKGYPEDEENLAYDDENDPEEVDPAEEWEKEEEEPSPIDQEVSWAESQDDEDW